MEALLAILIGGLYAVGIYLVLRRNVIKFIIGLAILSHGSNLLIFVVAGLQNTRPPIVAENELMSTAATADPIPQALVLTAIVISFAVLAFTVVLIHRAYALMGTEDLDNLEAHET